MTLSMKSSLSYNGKLFKGPLASQTPKHTILLETKEKIRMKTDGSYLIFECAFIDFYRRRKPDESVQDPFIPNCLRGFSVF